VGKIKEAMAFDGDGDQVVLGNDPAVLLDDSDISVLFWLYAVDFETRYMVGTYSSGNGKYYQTFTQAGMLRFSVDDDVIKSQLETEIEANTWYHIAAIREKGNQLRLYVDGVLAASVDDLTVGSIESDEALRFGNRAAGERDFNGRLDEVRLYNHALSEVEIVSAMEGKPWPYAFSPDPADGALISDTWANISWTPGVLAVSHDVYFGDNFDDVSAGAESTFVGNQEGTFIVVGFPGFPIPEGLVPGTTYYWRVDEVNEAEPNSPWKGSVWSFSIPPKTAYFPDPADGAESVALDTDLSWTAGFGAKLHHAYFGDNFDDVSNAAGALPLGEATYDPGPLELAKTYYWRVDEFDIIETHKGDVWSFTTEGAVGSPSPAKGAVDVTQTPVLTWVPGVFADTHEVYFGTDAEAVKNADTSSPEYKGSGNLGSESFEPVQLEWNTTYYWRIDEANNANTDSPPESNRIFNVWIDGYDDPTNGSLVGSDLPPFAEQTIVHSGNQSMPMSYDNAAGKSEATLTLTSNRDWTVNGVNRLTIWFRGSGGNAAETMYVVLNGSAGVDNDDPSAVQTTRWTEWNIDLQAFADQGVNLANVNSITLGLGNRANPVAGGAGMMYFDDIRLYATTP